MPNLTGRCASENLKLWVNREKSGPVFKTLGDEIPGLRNLMSTSGAASVRFCPEANSSAPVYTFPKLFFVIMLIDKLVLRPPIPCHSQLFER